LFDRRRVHRIPRSLHESKALKHGHCRGRTSSIGTDREDDGIWIYGLAGSFADLHRLSITNRHRLTFADRRRLAIDTLSAIDIASQSSAVINFYPRSMESALATTRGFSLTIGMLNFHINDAGISSLLPVVKTITPPSTLRLHRSLSLSECSKTTPRQHRRRHLPALAKRQNHRAPLSDRTSFVIAFVVASFVFLSRPLARCCA
jgi:hypothetical protein